MNIPTTIETYQEGVVDEQRIPMNTPYTYEPNPGEKINVLLWVRYPSYDLIFGVPDASNAHYELEYGFFQYRNTKKKEVVCGFYIDQNEIEEMVEGFGKMLVTSKKERLKDWEAYAAKRT